MKLDLKDKQQLFAENKLVLYLTIILRSLDYNLISLFTKKNCFNYYSKYVENNIPPKISINDT